MKEDKLAGSAGRADRQQASRVGSAGREQAALGCVYSRRGSSAGKRDAVEAVEPPGCPRQGLGCSTPNA